MKNRKKSLIWLFVILTQTALIVYLLINYRHTGGVSRYEINRAIDKYMSKNEEFALMLWDDTSQFKNANAICIKWWHNNRDGKYYIFVSEKLLKNGMYWIFPESSLVWIDGIKIDNGMSCDLGEGTYDVETVDKGIKSNYEMELRYLSNIAALFLNTQTGTMESINNSKEYYESGNYTLFDENGKFFHAGHIDNIHGRGNASWENEKKSYQINLQKPVNILDMGKDSKWVLISNSYDSTLLRNVIAYTLADSIGLAYTPKVRFVDVYANAEYLGNYILTEKIEISKNRVNIRNLQKQTEKINLKMFGNYEPFSEQNGRLKNIKGFMIKNEPDDISGGYLIELEVPERYDGEVSGFITARNQSVVVKSPLEASYQQINYIANLYQNFEDAVYADDGISTNTGQSYLEYIDIDSFSRKYLIEELVKNYDASLTSQYFYKPDDSISRKFLAGPAWDYDNSMGRWGEINGYNGGDPNGLYAAAKTRDCDLIWNMLYNKREFIESSTEIFFSELQPIATNIADNEINNYANRIIESAVNDAIRWGTYDDVVDDEEIKKLYNSDVDIVRKFLSNRIEFLSNEWSQYKNRF